jgi:benzoate/toluate 1,2-dioxygenase reductase component
VEGLTRVLSVSWLSPSTFALTMERPPGFQFRAGQSILLRHGDNERSYSIASGPDEPRLLLCVRLVEGGALSPLLAEARPGDTFGFDGPHGYFLYQGSLRQAVFVATGTGFAPFLSMARAGARGFIFLHGVRTVSELCFPEEMRDAAGLFIPCISGAPSSGAYHGRVTGWVADHMPPGPCDFYLCGNREMIRDVTLLVDERCDGSRVLAEAFH